MNLVIDIGNSYTKSAVFLNSDCLEVNADKGDSMEGLQYLLDRYSLIKNCIISSVSRSPDIFFNTLSALGLKPMILGPDTPLPFTVKYKTPETLGNDRRADAAGARCLYPGRNVLVIDAGTTITFDIISKQGEFLGGNISPGLTMRFKALHHFTSNLPLLESQAQDKLLGNDTRAAIINGVQNGILFEIEEYIRQLHKEFEPLIVILTGGDAQFFELFIKKTIFVVSNLTLIGLNSILDYNVQTT